MTKYRILHIPTGKYVSQAYWMYRDTWDMNLEYYLRDEIRTFKSYFYIPIDYYRVRNHKTIFTELDGEITLDVSKNEFLLIKEK